MGDFANTIFSVMLGWIRTAVQWVWSIAGSAEGGGMISWIGENWLPLVLALCGACMLVDGLVHLLRWQPHKVWASFFRRLTGRGEDEQNADSGRVRRQWIHADGTTSFDEVMAEEVMPEPEPEPEEPVFSPEEARAMRYALYQRPQPDQMPEAAQEENIPVAPVPRQRRRRYVPEEDEDMPLRYTPPPHAGEAPAYHEPYIPPQWRKPSNTGATTEGGNTL